MWQGILRVHITDFSVNGTYINGVRMEKNKTYILFNGDCVAIDRPTNTREYIPGRIDQIYHYFLFLYKNKCKEMLRKLLIKKLY